MSERDQGSDKRRYDMTHPEIEGLRDGVWQESEYTVAK